MSHYRYATGATGKWVLCLSSVLPVALVGAAIGILIEAQAMAFVIVKEALIEGAIRESHSALTHSFVVLKTAFVSVPVSPR